MTNILSKTAYIFFWNIHNSLLMVRYKYIFFLAESRYQPSSANNTGDGLPAPDQPAANPGKYDTELNIILNYP